MHKIILAASLVAAPLTPTMAESPDHRTSLAPSAQNETPPSGEKLELIKRFMTVVGIQSRLDSGSFLEQYAFIAELGWHEGEVEISEALTGPVEALKAEYEKYRSIYQSEYEQHLNWEFTEDELRQMVAFFETPVGRHYLAGSWRMEAYIGTNMEETEQALVAEAVKSYRSR
ncbi:DUF2059 domain-containing protein [Qipengyuania sp. 1XM1-15A]|uniref:DUF2059 domain-containing protein n=1 Tax=Qipengyuania xiamenensis TaxID=2867237 RepID=UPI001C87E881|nr:DUF2059 domain-containing protein [Qipengyuania xiamenensis]MBX7534031.1 DUF2059 domain-containing protein [Qipengyuania xiamenensis]